MTDGDVDRSKKRPTERKRLRMIESVIDGDTKQVTNDTV